MVDSLLADSLLIDGEPEDKESILQQIFGKKRQDTVQVKEVSKPKIVPRDTVATLTPNRKERREQRKNERESKNKNKNN